MGGQFVEPAVMNKQPAIRTDQLARRQGVPATFASADRHLLHRQSFPPVPKSVIRMPDGRDEGDERSGSHFLCISPVAAGPEVEMLQV
jgi:hypothetical protein